MPDHSDTPHSLVTAFAVKPAAKVSPLEAHAAQLRADTEEKIKFMKLAADTCKEIGYDIEAMQDHLVVNFLQTAIDTVSSRNGHAAGDSYKPFDPDMAHPTKETLRAYLTNACANARVPKVVVPAEPEFAFVAA